MKILIVGSDLNSLLLAKYIKLQSSEHDIYITADDNSASEDYTCININDNDINAIVDFVKYNAIEFTIALSPLSIINGIADEFRKQEFPIFAPYAESARITFFNSIAKKILYKLKINTPKFGIFDRENIALDYIRRSKFPIVIGNDFTLMNREMNIYKSFSKARTGIQKIFENNNERIIIENYIDEQPVYVYFITDGYNALPLIGIEKTFGNNYIIGCAPSKKISDDLYIKILRHAIYPLLDDITKYTDNYIGIIGLKIKIAKDSFGVLEVYNSFQDYDLQTFLALCDENLFNIFYDTANGCLGDNYEYVKLNENFAYTVAVDKSAVKKPDDSEDDFIESEDSTKYIITSAGATINYAKENIYDYLELILQKDLFNDIIEQDRAKEKMI